MILLIKRVLGRDSTGYGVLDNPPYLSASTSLLIFQCTGNGKDALIFDNLRNKINDRTRGCVHSTCCFLGSIHHLAVAEPDCF